MKDVFSLQIEPFEGEEFRSVVGYDGYYSVSNYGRVRSERRERSIGGYIKERIRKIQVINDGQCCVNLYQNNKPKSFLISNLVADAFIEKSRNGKHLVVIHKNKNPKDNSLSNLFVDTKSISNKIDFKLGITQHNIDALAKKAIKRGEYRDKNFGIYENGILIGYVCTRCLNEFLLSEFTHTNTICKRCKAISEGVLDYGKVQRRKELSNLGLQECSKCKKSKPFNEFYKDKNRKNGIISKCKICY